MKKINLKIKWIVPFILLVILVFVLPLFFVNNKKQNHLNSYKLDLIFHEEKYLLYGEERVDYYNNSENMFTHLYFHLYPNAFREGMKNRVVSSSKEKEAYPNGESYGKIDIKKVCDQNQELEFQIVGEDENILEVKLNQPIYPDELAVVNIDFETSLANINHRLGYGDSTINLGNFYPIACVYEDGKGFSQSLYHSNGDPFYSDCANYDVTIKCSSKFEIASGGEVKSSTVSNEIKENKYKGNKIRDFCIVLSEKLSKESKVVDGIEICYYGYQGDSNLKKCLNIAEDAVKTFNKMFGKYPYKQLSVVKSNFVHGGMEFPNIVLISDTIEEQKDVNYVIVHEIAHQWWYGLVGNDQYNHAWQDEGLAEYSTLLFFKNNPSYGEDFKSMVSSANNSYKLFEEVYTKVQGSVDKKMDRPLCDFETEPEYIQCTYTKGVLLFNNVHELLGDKNFFKALKKYFQSFKYKNACPEDMIAAFVDYGGNKMEKLFKSWLMGSVIFK